MQPNEEQYRRPLDTVIYQASPLCCAHIRANIQPPRLQVFLCVNADTPKRTLLETLKMLIF